MSQYKPDAPASACISWRQMHALAGASGLYWQLQASRILSAKSSFLRSFRAD